MEVTRYVAQFFKTFWFLLGFGLKDALRKCNRYSREGQTHCVELSNTTNYPIFDCYESLRAKAFREALVMQFG